MKLLSVLLLIAVHLAQAVEWADSPALTNVWQATSSGDVDRLVDVMVQTREVALARSGDGRGPLFWAYEFKNMEALALLLHMGADDDAEDSDGMRPRDFFPDGAEELSEFVAAAESKTEDMASTLKEREEEFASYQIDPSESYGDDEDETPSVGAERDEIDYADDEDDEDEIEDMSAETKQRLAELRQKAGGDKDEV